MSENVDHPAHYNQSGTETITIIQEALTPEQFEGFLLGNAFKYLHRYPHKGKPVEDIEKAKWYLDRLSHEVLKKGS